ncbi:hypothetical protein ACIHFE_27785 [Streptomyces sp. NPDC052396]|uniref:hypothetical protein n=1 Tax=Streptomyces sp. NPDC052396 TaxID=3365689 RepID=UPI0037CD0891
MAAVLVATTGFTPVTTAYAAPSPAVAAPVTSVAPPRDLSYHYSYHLNINWPQSELLTATSLMGIVANDFGHLFPFGGNCTSLPAVGGVCHLMSAGHNNPVQVVGRTPTSFTFKSLPGHAEGAGRYITFTFIRTGTSGPGIAHTLSVHAWGPWTPAAAATVSSGLARSIWQQFATNIGNAFH